MKAQFLKLAGVKSEADFYKRFPTEEAFFQAYPEAQMMAQGGEMIKRADGSYSKRGLWDNIRANKGSGKKPTKEMLEQEAKIRKQEKMFLGGSMDDMKNKAMQMAPMLMKFAPMLFGAPPVMGHGGQPCYECGGMYAMGGGYHTMPDGSIMADSEMTSYKDGGGIPERYKNKGFTKVGAKRESTRPGKKWMVLAKKGDQYKVVHGGYDGMKDYTQHGSEKRRDKFWSRMGGKNSSKAKDPFSPLYWHKRFGTWKDGGQPDLPMAQAGLSFEDWLAQNGTDMLMGNEQQMYQQYQNEMSLQNLGAANTPVSSQLNPKNFTGFNNPSGMEGFKFNNYNPTKLGVGYSTNSTSAKTDPKKNPAVGMNLFGSNFNVELNEKALREYMKTNQFLDMTKGAINGFITQPRKEREAADRMRSQTMTDNLFAVDTNRSGSRGDYATTGSGYGMFRPDEIGAKSPDGMYNARFYPQQNFEEGGEYELSEDEIMNIMAMGGDVEFL